MFPICPRCKCETLDENCGGWTPDFQHDCLKALHDSETAVLRMLDDVQQRIQLYRRAQKQDNIYFT